MANYEIVNYNIVNGIYKTKVNMEKELKDAGIEVVGNQEFYNVTCNSEIPKTKVSFKKLFQDYCALRKAEPAYTLKKNLDIERIEFQNSLVKEAYETIGEDEVRKLKYKVTDIKRKLMNMRKETQDVKIFKILDSSLPKQTYITVSDAKKKIQKAYDDIGLDCKAKSTDLSK